MIERGKITLWEQVPVPDANPGTPTQPTESTPTASGPVA